MEKKYSINVTERVLHFRQPAGTSRGVYTTRRSWFVTVSDGSNEGVGECAPLPDLSCDALPPERYAEVLRRFCDQVEQSGQIDFEAMREHTQREGKKCLPKGRQVCPAGFIYTLGSHHCQKNSQESDMKTQTIMYTGQVK